MGKQMLLTGAGNWDGAVSEDGLYEGIDWAVDQLDLDEDSHEHQRDLAIAALWPPEHFPVGYEATYTIPGGRTLTVTIKEAKTHG